HKIPFIVKLNHNDLLVYPPKYDQTLFASVQQASDLGAMGVGATIYFGSEESARQIGEVGNAFAEAHRLGMFTVLWCYVRNAVINKRAGGMGLIVGRKAFQRPLADGIALLNAVQDVYRDAAITVA